MQKIISYSMIARPNPAELVQEVNRLIETNKLQPFGSPVYTGNTIIQVLVQYASDKE